MSAQTPTTYSRYPRPQWLRLLRSLAIRWWLIPIAILTLYILFDVIYALISREDVISFIISSIKNLWITIPIVLLLIISIPTGIFVSRKAEVDEQNERLEEVREQIEEARRQSEEARRQSREREMQPPPEGFKLRHVLSGHSNSILSVGWSPDGQKLASGSSDNTIRVWDAQTGQELQTLTGHTSSVYSVGWSPDGQKLASGSRDSTIRVWDAQTGQELQTLSGHLEEVDCITWLSNGQKLASGSSDNTIRIWDILMGNQSRVLEGHTDAILSIANSFDGRFLVSRSKDATIRLWRTDT